MNAIARTTALFLAAASLSACALFPSAHDRAVRKTPNFKAGYSDGCAAANAAGSSYRYGPVRDETQFQQDPVYRAGWNTGYGSCRSSNAAPGSMPGSMLPEPSPGH